MQGIKADMNSDIHVPLETAAIFFVSSEPLSKTGHWLGVCYGWFHLHGLTRHVRNANRDSQNDKYLPTMGFEPGPSAKEATSLSVALLDDTSIKHLKLDRVLPEFVM